MVAGDASWDRLPTSVLDARGLHPGTLGDKMMAKLIYNGTASTYGWPVVPAYRGLVGRRPDYPSPPSILCQA